MDGIIVPRAAFGYLTEHHCAADPRRHGTLIRHLFFDRAPPQRVPGSVLPLPCRVVMRATAAVLVAFPGRPQRRRPALRGAVRRAIHLPSVTPATHAHPLAAAPAIKLPNRLPHRPRAPHRALDSTGASRHKGSAGRLASKQP
jgi:hypothetical protein